MNNIDLRRDTITIPDDEMKRSAFSAELGDSVYGEDPNQVELEKLAADITGKEASIFLPSGTMGNLVAVLSHTNRGDEIIMEENAHIFTSETGGAAAIGGVSIQRLRGHCGLPEPAEIKNAIRKHDIHYPPTTLICLEMSHYRYGGIVPPLEKLNNIRALSQETRIPVHLDGARLFNAATYLNTDVKTITGKTDSVMFCLSKGLGAPAGSMLCGSHNFIEKAKRYRKMLGGGMRQTGWLCSCGISALSEDNINKLKTDHENALLLAKLLNTNPLIDISLSLTHTNFVVAQFRDEFQAENLGDYLYKKNILINKPKSDKIVFVISRQVNNTDIRTATTEINNFLQDYNR